MLLKQMAILDKGIQNHALRRLAHLMTGEDSKAIESAQDFLVEQALLEGGRNKSLTEVSTKLRATFGLKFGNPEVSKSLDRLLTKGVVTKDKERFSLDEGREGQLKKLNSDTKAQEKAVYQDWLYEVVVRYPQIDKDESEILLEDLKLYINQTLLLNGAEVATLIRPGTDESTISGATLDVIRNLPQRNSKLTEIRRLEFPRFFKDANKTRRSYVVRLMDGTFIYSIIQVDSQTLELVKNNFKNYVFYLDTNILYSLLNLQDPRRASSVEKAVNIAKEYGMKFVVSFKTIEEMRKSIELKSEVLLKSPSVRRDLAEVGAELSEEENFTTAYWRAYAKTGVSKRDFVEKFKYIPDLLRAQKIDISKYDYQPKVRELEDEKSLLRESAPLKTNTIAEHDAYHRLLIQKLRTEEERRGGKQKFWFLSWDGQVTNYAFLNKKREDAPFALLPHQLMQVMRLYSRRTDDYDATFLELFSKPQIKSAQGVLPNNFAEKILAKISNYEDLPPDLALKVLMDSNFVRTIVNETNEEFQDKILEKKIDKEILEKLNNLSGRIQVLEADKLKAVSDINQLQGKYEGSVDAVSNKDRKIILLEGYLVTVLLAILALMNAFLVSMYWDQASWQLRIVCLSIDIFLGLLILRIKWGFSSVSQVIATLVTIATAVFWVASIRPAETVEPRERESLSINASTTSNQASSSLSTSTQISPK